MNIRSWTTLAAKGAVAGVAAAAATSLFQTLWTRLRLPPTDAGTAPVPPTEVLAARVAGALGWPLRPAGLSVAGEAVHYAMGAGLGVAYVLLAARWPAIRAANGAAYGLGAWLIVEEGGLTVTALKPPPWRVEASEHLFAAGSHLVFGLVVDGVASTIMRPAAGRQQQPGENAMRAVHRQVSGEVHDAKMADRRPIEPA